MLSPPRDTARRCGSASQRAIKRCAFDPTIGRRSSVFLTTYAPCWWRTGRRWCFRKSRTPSFTLARFGPLSMPCSAEQPSSRVPSSHKSALVLHCSCSTLNPALPIETIVSLVVQVFDKEGIKHVRIAPGDSAVDREVAAHSFKTDPTV